MNEISINFSPLSDKAINLLASKIHKAITTEPCTGYFPNIEPPPSQLKEYNDLLGAALAQETSVSVTALRKSRRKDVVDTLAVLAADLEKTAKGDLMKLAATGFDLKKAASRTGAATETPQNFRAAPTGITGQVLAKCNVVKGARAYHAQYSLTADGPWLDIDPVTASQKILFTGLERGKDVYLRVRAFGPNGYSGWSDIAVVMVV